MGRYKYWAREVRGADADAVRELVREGEEAVAASSAKHHGFFGKRYSITISPHADHTWLFCSVSHRQLTTYSPFSVGTFTRSTSS